MPKLRKGFTKWNEKRNSYVARLDWTDADGKKHCRKRQVENKTKGNDEINKWIRDLEEQGEAYLEAEKITFAQAAEKYKDKRLIPPVYRGGKKVEGLRDWEGQRNRLQKLIDRFGKKRIRSFTFTDLKDYRTELLDTPVVHKKKDGTVVKTKERSIGDVHRNLSLLKAVFTYAVQCEWLTRNPFSKGKGLIVLAQEVPRDRILSTEEQRKLLEACQNDNRRHLYPLILVALDTGCRRGELLKLQWLYVNLEKGTVRIVATNAKTDRQRLIDLEPITVTELRRLAEESGAFATDLVFGIKSNFTRGLRSAMKVAGIEGARFHDCRATAITTWLLRGMPMPFAMARSGHADPRTFMRYVRMAEEIREKQRAHLREWDLAASLAELASNGRGVSTTGAASSSIKDGLQRTELIG